jgi:hypothetical protein
MPAYYVAAQHDYPTQAIREGLATADSLHFMPHSASNRIPANPVAHPSALAGNSLWHNNSLAD